MKNNFLKSMFPMWMLLVAGFALITVGCGDEEEPPPSGGDDPIASFQFEVDANDFLTVNFSNFSQNATSYSWDFGDGSNSTEESPSHTYAAAGDYDVILTASNADGKSAMRTQSISITDPNMQLSLLAGSTSKTWYLQREGIALGVGPAVNDVGWWSFGGVTPLGDRPCILDDQYIFHRDGTFEFNSNGTLFVDLVANGGWTIDGMDSEICHDESESDIWGDNSDRSAFGSGGDYNFVLDNANNSLTINGTGAYIGLCNKTDAGDNPNPIDIKTYTVSNLAQGDIADSLSVAIVGDGFVWNFYLVSYHNPADLPDLPSAEPRADFSETKDNLTVSFNNTSVNSTSFMWDFGDGGMSSDVNPVYTYSAAGDYDVTLTAMDDMGGSNSITKTVSVSEAVFSGDVLSNDEGKVWRLAGEASYKVGPAPGSGEWWGGLDAAGVEERACQLDDEFIFLNDGSFNFDSKGQVWAEDYMGGAFACTNDGDLLAPFDVLGSGNHMFSVMEADGSNPARIRVVGSGAYIGFSKPLNGGELPNDGTGTPASEIVYDVIGFTSTAERDEIILAIDFVGDGIRMVDHNH